MTKFTFAALAAISVGLAGCQKTKLSSAQPAASNSVVPSSPTPSNFAPAPAAPLGGGGGALPPPTMQGPPPDTRLPQPEPRDPVVVSAPPPTQTLPPPPPHVNLPAPVPVGTSNPTPPPSSPPPTTSSNPPPSVSTPWTPTGSTTPVTGQPPVINPPPTTTSNPPANPPPVNTVVEPPTSTPTTVGNPPPNTTVNGGFPTTPDNPPLPTANPNRPGLPPPLADGSVITVPQQAPTKMAMSGVQPPPPSAMSSAPAGPSTAPAAPSSPPTVQHVDPVQGSCDVRDVTTVETKQMDILFVVDTSASLVKGAQHSRGGEGGELAQIAAQMPAFVKELPSDMNIRIGVLLGHGPASPYFGKPYAPSGVPKILDSTKMSKTQMWEALKRTMTAPPDDTSDAQGEALLLATYEALTKHFGEFNQNGKGLFRKNTNTIIINVSDEQDVCWNYPGLAYPTGAMTVDEAAFARGSVPVLKPYSSKKGKTILSPDVHEMRFFSDVCQHFVGGTRNKSTGRYEGGSPLDIDAVRGAFDRLAATTGAKVIPNGIVYASNSGLKASVSNEDENEMGHGTIDLVKAVNEGEIADMKEARADEIDFSKALKLIGSTAGFQLKGGNVFNCYSNTYNPDAIDFSQPVELFITDSSGRSVAHLNSDCNKVSSCQHGDSGLIAEARPGANGYHYLRVSPKDKAAFMQSLKNLDGGKYEIKFTTKRDYDIKTGRPVNADAAAAAKPAKAKSKK